MKHLDIPADAGLSARMGGNAFPGILASRLSTPQLAQLLAYVETRLTPHPFKTLDSPRYPLSKSTHGDLDVLCSWAEGTVGVYPKGQDIRVLDYEGDDAGNMEGLNGLMIQCGKILGAREMRKGGMEASFRVPRWRVYPEEYEVTEFTKDEVSALRLYLYEYMTSLHDTLSQEMLMYAVCCSAFLSSRPHPTSIASSRLRLSNIVIRPYPPSPLYRCSPLVTLPNLALGLLDHPSSTLPRFTTSDYPSHSFPLSSMRVARPRLP
jgi:hypothetical protein